VENHRPIRIGTRGSALAKVQAKRVQALFKLNGIGSSIHVIQTTGDLKTDPIHLLGGKGVFVKDIEAALMHHDIDIAVHSFKDITATPETGLVYSGFLMEERSTDAIILFTDSDIHKQPARLGTGSLRRKALCDHLYPKVTCIPMRGNIDTRIKNAKALNYDGVILSTAGLQRLKLDHLISHELDPRAFIPAPGQGMLALQARCNDNDSINAINGIVNQYDQAIGRHYFELLKGVEFNCNVPLGAQIINQEWHVFLGANGAQYFRHPLADTMGVIKRVKVAAHA
jgi:hydroxymethylbilane synthase